MLRSILHCDMNNFYASVECMLDPALKKYPIAVCGSVEERHGIVLAKNYKAKAFDVKTGDAVLLLMYNLPQKMSVFGQLIELLIGNVMLHLRESKELSNRM